MYNLLSYFLLFFISCSNFQANAAKRKLDCDTGTKEYAEPPLKKRRISKIVEEKELVTSIQNKHIDTSVALAKNKIIISEYNHEWPKYYEEESKLITKNLKKFLIEIHHVGSTAVPQLAAKPIIDILLVVKDITKIIDPLQKIKYKFKGEYNLPLRYFFNKKGKYKIYLHVHEEGSPEIELNLKFRDYLIKNPAIRKKYENVKKEATKEKNSTEKTKTGITLYNLKKNSIIKEILKASNFKGLCPRFCTQEDEWKICNTVRKEQKIKIDEHNKDTHKCLVLYEGTEIVAVANIDLSVEKKLKILFVENYMKEDTKYKKYLKNFINKYAEKNQRVVIS